MRDKGLDVPDPVLLADGAVDWATLKESMSQDPNFDENDSRTKSALDECSPILERVVMVDKQSPEDEIEFQDKSLDFAQCIREGGLDVPDPDFSDGTRSGNKTILTKIKSPDARVSKILDICKETAFGTGDSSR